MPGDTPHNANQFIERELDSRARNLAEAFDAETLSFTGPLIHGTDDIVHRTIEEMRKDASNKDRLVVVLTTTGGYIEVVQRIVETMRHHYRYVDFVVPNHAFSAGTVLAMSGDSIYMNYYSRLGPIDPQVEGQNNRQVPALGYLIQWERLLKKAREGTITTVEASLLLNKFDLAELYKYEQARELSITLLKRWLVSYKFKDWNHTQDRGIRVTSSMKSRRAASIAKMLSNTERWHSHGYGISMEELRNEVKVRIDDFDADPDKSETVRAYYGLLDDYMLRRGHKGAVHAPGRYLPFLYDERGT